MLKRSQQQADQTSRHWYQDKYQHVLVQRNILALIALVALGVALIAVFTVSRLSPLKSVEPYLLQVDDKTGITQKVEPVSRAQYTANPAIDRYFVSLYVRTREGYNPTIRNYNDNIVRVMSRTEVFRAYRRDSSSANPASVVSQLGSYGIRSVSIASISYIVNPAASGDERDVTPERIMQVRLALTDSKPNSADVTTRWVATVGFVYANAELNESEQLLNPLGFIVTSYQIQRELN